jgi:hypothetical protein
MRENSDFAEVEALASDFLTGLQSPSLGAAIAEVHKLGASSHKIQELVEPLAIEMGFTSE